MSVEINATNFPDSVFRQYISENFDKDSDGVLSDTEIEAIDVMDIPSRLVIETFAGIQYLTSLEKLFIRSSGLESVDIHNCKNLKHLMIMGNRTLASVNANGCEKLELLDLDGSHALSSLFIDGCYSLKGVNLTFNNLISLDLSGRDKLELLRLNFPKRLESLNLSGCTSLKYLWAARDDSYPSVLTDVNIKDCESLRILNINGHSAIQRLILPKANDLHTLELDGLEMPAVNISKNAKLKEIVSTATKETAAGSYGRCYLYRTGGSIDSNLDNDLIFRTIVYSTAAYPDTLNFIIFPVEMILSQKAIEIIEQPEDIYLSESDQGATFTVEASGDNLQYQWQKWKETDEIWEDIAVDANTNSYYVENDISNNNSVYRCLVYNTETVEYSDSASFHRVTSPIILQQPVDILATEGSTAVFQITTSRQGNIEDEYEWHFSVDEGATWEIDTTFTNNTYSIMAENDINGYCVKCRVYNNYGETYSNVATLTVTPDSRSSSPAILNLTEGQSGILEISTTDHDEAYQWQASGNEGETWTDLRGATNPTYNVLATLAIDGYRYRCIVTIPTRDIESEASILTVTPDTSITPPVITMQPSSITVAEGSSATFAVEVSGSDISYQWQVFKNNQWTNIQNATSTFYTIVGTRSADGNRYRCVISNAAGAIYSDPATLTVTMGVYVSTPRVLTQPRSVNVELGELVTFWVRADGGDLSYQWQKLHNGTWYDITGATSASYVVMARTEVHNTQYRCVITNTAGSVTSNTATLSIRAGHDLSFYGYHSIIISGKNTYGEWEMYPTSRPHVAPPEVKTSYVDLPGADGGLDYTDLLTGEPRYGYRKGSWEFLLIPQDRWAAVYRSLVNFLHGRQHTVILEDDPNYVYTGRLSVNEWQSAAHNSLITIDYILEPFPRNISGQEEDEEENQILSMASTLLNKEKYAGMVIGKLNGSATLIYPDMLFDDGDNIAY